MKKMLAMIVALTICICGTISVSAEDIESKMSSIREQAAASGVNTTAPAITTAPELSTGTTATTSPVSVDVGVSDISDGQLHNSDITDDTDKDATANRVESFQKEMTTFLTMSGFNYDEFNSNKFELPDVSSFATQADLTMQYSDLLSDMSKLGYGKQAVLPSNEGYTQNIISSFSDKFGKGLSEGYSVAKLDFDPTAIFENAASTRDSLFSSAMSSGDYQAVAANLNISDTFAKVNTYMLDPNSIQTSLTSMSTLSSSIKGAFDKMHTDQSHKNSQDKISKKFAFNSFTSHVADYYDNASSDPSNLWSNYDDNYSTDVETHTNWFNNIHKNGNMLFTLDDLNDAIESDTLSGLELPDIPFFNK